MGEGLGHGFCVTLEGRGCCLNVATHGSCLDRDLDPGCLLRTTPTSCLSSPNLHTHISPQQPILQRAILVEHTGQAAREPSDATATTAGACTAAVPQQQGRQHYDRVLYVGDGSNDVCPALWLGPRDAVFARRGLALAKALQAMQQQAQHAQQQGHCAQSGGPPGQPGARHGDEYDLSQGGAAQEGQPCPPSAAPVAAGLGSTGAQSDGAAAAGAADAAGGPGEALRAQLVVWDSGEEILQWIKQNLELAPAAV